MPRLRRDVPLAAKIENPVGFHKLVTVIQVQFLHERLGLVVRDDSIGSNEKEDIRRIRLLVRIGLLGNFSAQADNFAQKLHRAHGQGRKRFSSRMKHQRIAGAFHINRLAIGAVLAMVRHQRVGFLLAPFDRLQIVQGSFELVQFAGKAFQILLGRLFPRAGVGQHSTANGQLRAFLVQIRFLIANGLVQRDDLQFFVFEALQSGILVSQDGPELVLQFDLLLHQQLVKLANLAFPFLLIDRAGLGFLGRDLGRDLRSLGPRHHLRSAIEHQQQQDQRPHGAQKHRQEWKGVNMNVPFPAHGEKGLQIAECRLQIELPDSVFQSAICILQSAITSLHQAAFLGQAVAVPVRAVNR